MKDSGNVHSFNNAWRKFVPRILFIYIYYLRKMLSLISRQNVNDFAFERIILINNKYRSVKFAVFVCYFLNIWITKMAGGGKIAAVAEISHFSLIGVLPVAADMFRNRPTLTYWHFLLLYTYICMFVLYVYEVN